MKITKLTYSSGNIGNTMGVLALMLNPGNYNPDHSEKKCALCGHRVTTHRNKGFCCRDNDEEWEKGKYCPCDLELFVNDTAGHKQT